MGSMSRYSAIERFVNHFGEKLETHFNYLLGSTATACEGYAVDYHVSADIVLDTVNGSETFPTHCRWASEEETSEGKELDDEGDDESDELKEVDFTYEYYLNERIVGKTVEKLSVGHADRDDEVYLLLYFSEQDILEIPLGFNPENAEIGGFAEDLITEEEFEAFLQLA